MSNYDQSQHNRNYPAHTIDADGKGTGLLWVLIAIAALGLLVLVGSFGGGSTTVQHPGGVGADPIVAPINPEPIPTDGTPVVE